MQIIYKYEELEEMMDNGKDIVFVDVRTEREYRKNTIPDAISIPILEDEQYAEIGTLYKAGEIEQAKLQGIRYTSERLPEIYEKITSLVKEHDHVVLFCSRGGYRSSVIFNTLRSLSINVFKLDGGYKHYRRYINTRIPELIENTDFIVLNGGTGSGKTEILYHMEELGMNVLDLEKCANHRGSLLGHIGLGEIMSQKMFESNIYHRLRLYEGSEVFVEGESKRIGRVFLPGKMKEKMNEGVQLKITTPIKHRVDIIKREYVEPNTDKELKDGIWKLERYMSQENIEKYCNMIENGEYDEAIEGLITRYYDPKYNIRVECIKEFINNSSSVTAEEIKSWYEAEKNGKQ